MIFATIRNKEIGTIEWEFKGKDVKLAHKALLKEFGCALANELSKSNPVWRFWNGRILTTVTLSGAIIRKFGYRTPLA